MKFEKNKRYFTIAVYAFLVIAAAMLFFFALLYPQKIFGTIGLVLSILTPLIVGFAIAFILNPVLNFFEKIVFKKMFTKKSEQKGKRALSLICTYIIFLGLISLFLMLVIPSLISSITDLIKNIKNYYASGIEIAKDLLARFNISDDFLEPFTDLGSKLVEYTIDAMNSILPRLYGIALSATSFLKNAVVGFAFSIYMLAGKEVFKKQFLKVLETFTKPLTQARVKRVASLSYDTFSKYLSGYLVDSIIVGIICFIVMSIFGWPYPALISIIIGFSNMIPFFGPFIGGIPSVLLILLVNPWHALFFAIFIVILQQIDGNFICPKILGQIVGLSSFWVMVAIVVGGSVFGIAGMVISVPSFAVIYSLARSYLERKHKQKLKESKADEV